MAEELNETKLAKLSPADVAGFAGEPDRFEAVDKGVDLPEAPFEDITTGKIFLELIGGGLFGTCELLDQLNPVRSFMVGGLHSAV